MSLPPISSRPGTTATPEEHQEKEREREAPQASRRLEESPGLEGSPALAESPASQAPQAPQKAMSEMSLASQAITPGAISPPGPAAAAAPHELTALNLARRPFVNSRPVKRLALLLWALGALLLTGNVSLFWSYLGSSEQTRAALAEAELQTERERRNVAQLSNRISGMNLEQQNREVAYLNRKIAERTFSWSLLFDRLAEVLPDGVRLSQLSPEGPAEKEQPSRTGPIASADKNTPIALQILGEAKNDEALFHFVDRLFAHPSFAEPDPGREDRVEPGLLKFDLKVKYLPASADIAASPSRHPANAADQAEPASPASPKNPKNTAKGPATALRHDAKPTRTRPATQVPR